MSKDNPTTIRKKAGKNQPQHHQTTPLPSDDVSKTHTVVSSESLEAQVAMLKNVDSLHSKQVLSQIGKQHGNKQVQRIVAAINPGGKENNSSIQLKPEDIIQTGLFDDIALGASNLYHNAAEGVGLETHDEAEAGRLEAFINHGLFGPESLVPPTDIGGFDASYNPQSQQLGIKVKTGINFLHGLEIDSSGTIVAKHTDLTQAATDGNTLPIANRAAFVNQFTWSRAQERTFSRQIRTRILNAWDGQYSFFCTRPGWESIVADVLVNVDVHRGDAGENDHLQTSAYKVPEGGQYQVGAYVDSDRDSTTNFSDQDPHNNEMVVSSTHVNPNQGQRNLLKKSVSFAHNSSELTANSQAMLNAFVADFQDANLDLTNPVELIGHASSPGSEAYNAQLAQRRIDVVQAHLSTAGFTGINSRLSTQIVGESGAMEDAAWRRVDMIVGDGQGQVVAAHEFGHVIGLRDEYAINPGGSIRGSGNPTGTVVGHDAVAQAVGASGAIAENNDNIMSLGAVVRPQHYATFGWALKQVTEVDEWKVG